MRTAFRLLFGSVLAVLIASPAFAADPSPLPITKACGGIRPPESESGWGINFAHQGDVIFATWFTYDAAGDGWWLAMTANKTAEGTYSGTLLETAGPAFSAMPFDPAKVTRTAVGSGTLTFRDLDNATFSYTVKGVQQTKFITRQAFGPLPTCTYAAQPDFAAATNYQDIWWVAGRRRIRLGDQPHAPGRRHLRHLVHLRHRWHAPVAGRDCAPDHAGRLSAGS